MTWPLASTYGVGRYVAAEADYTIGSSRAWSGNKPRLIYCHGATSTTAEVFTWPEQVALIRDLAQDYLVTVADLGFDTYGNDLAATRVGEALAYQAATFGATGPAVLVGASMGALTAMVYALNNPANVAAVVGIIPAVDIADLYTANPSLQAAINTAYSPAYNDATHGPTHSPVQFAASIAASIPVALFYSSNDTQARPGPVLAFDAARPSTSVTSVGALGHTNAAIGAASPGVRSFLAGL